MITAVDLLTFDMDIESLKPDSPTLHTFLFEIMDKIQSETNFNPSNGQIIVEASQTGEESIMLTVTRIAREIPQNPKTKKERFADSTPVIKKDKKKVYVYAFITFDDLKYVLSKMDTDLLTDGFACELDKKYYLCITVGANDKCHGLLREYSCDIDMSLVNDMFLFEHGRIIAEKESLISLANGIREYEL